MGHHHHNHGEHHGAWQPGGQWVGGFYGVPTTTIYNGAPLGHYQPMYAYPVGHPYHHSNFHYMGQPIGAYQHGYAYPVGHPYHGFH
eukprot:TRINITY_DN54_c0_g1_i1.p3 TRINITY_DN54_c0_g1~~TRINITY_DN54_c0_g1_i1.p3  ORF type:complete len:98 (-),score=29.55 TRINITY_DN54_c0_g1_i1:75-332(-)